jgi:integrase
MTRAAIAKYSATRRSEKHHAKQISEATINKELRSIRAFLREAHKRGYLSNPPVIALLKEPERIPTYIDPETFAKLYEHAAAAGAPSEQGFTAEQWWRAYMVFLYLTGWRAFEPLALTKEDIDWEAGRVLLRAEHNKGKRDAMVTLHPLVLEHLKAVKSFGPMLFPWDLPRRKLWDRFHLIQEAAGVCKRAGKPFGFHDLRRGFATMNADRMSADALQAIMRHKDYGTTKRYINIARQLNPAVANIYVPDLPAKKEGLA